MNVLITGGAGFIGSHLAERLIADHRVDVLDDLSTGRMENLKGLVDHRHFRFIRGSVREQNVVALLMERADLVYHLAAAVGVQLIVDRPVHTIETNIHGSETVLAEANRFGTGVVLASTSEVYGKSHRFPFNEDDDTVMGATTHSRWSYACSKAIDEFLGLAYHCETGLPVTIARLFNTVGPRQSGQYGMVVPRFVEAGLCGAPVQVYGDGRQSRCFCHVADVVEALVKLGANRQAAGEVFNIGSAEEITIDGLADRVIELTGGKSTKVHIPYEEAYGPGFEDMSRRVPDISKIGSLLSWRPTRDLHQILKDVIVDCRSRR